MGIEGRKPTPNLSATSRFARTTVNRIAGSLAEEGNRGFVFWGAPAPGQRLPRHSPVVIGDAGPVRFSCGRGRLAGDERQ